MPYMVLMLVVIVGTVFYFQFQIFFKSIGEIFTINIVLAIQLNISA